MARETLTRSWTTGGAAAGAGRIAISVAVAIMMASLAYAGGKPTRRPAAPAAQDGVVLKKVKAVADSGKPAAKGPSANVGQVIVLAGSGFVEPLHVEFFGFAGSAFVVNPARVSDGKKVSVAVPEAAASGPVRIVTSTTGASEPVRLQIVPVVTSVSASPAVPGTRLLIDGTGYTYDSQVFFAGVSGPVAPVIASPTRLDVLVPAGARSGKLTVQTPGGRSKAIKIKIGTGAEAASRESGASRARRVGGAKAAGAKAAPPRAAAGTMR